MSEKWRRQEKYEGREVLKVGILNASEAEGEVERSNCKKGRRCGKVD